MKSADTFWDAQRASITEAIYSTTPRMRRGMTRTEYCVAIRRHRYNTACKLTPHIVARFEKRAAQRRGNGALKS